MLSKLKKIYHGGIRAATTFYCRMGLVHRTRFQADNELLESTWPWHEPVCIAKAPSDIGGGVLI